MPSRWGVTRREGGSDRTPSSCLQVTVTPLSVLYPSKFDQSYFNNIKQSKFSTQMLKSVFTLSTTRQCFLAAADLQCARLQPPSQHTTFCSNWLPETADSTVFENTQRPNHRYWSPAWRVSKLNSSQLKQTLHLHQSFPVSPDIASWIYPLSLLLMTVESTTA